jgi:hypothetical protein
VRRDYVSFVAHHISVPDAPNAGAEFRQSMADSAACGAFTTARRARIDGKVCNSRCWSAEAPIVHAHRRRISNDAKKCTFSRQMHHRRATRRSINHFCFSKAKCRKRSL